MNFIMIVFAIIEFVFIKLQKKTYPYLEVIAALTTFFTKKLFLRTLFTFISFDLAISVYNAGFQLVNNINWMGHLGLFIFVDFLYYWHHRLAHSVKIAWIAHSIHHLPNRLTMLSTYQTAVVSSFFAPFRVLIFPLALIGIHPKILIYYLGINILYQVWYHNEFIGELGFLERFLNTPAQHRIHHSILPQHQNKNFGGILCVFDRIFKTYHLDRVDIKRFGVQPGVLVRHPFTPLFYEISQLNLLCRKLFSTNGWKNKIRALIKIE